MFSDILMNNEETSRIMGVFVGIVTNNKDPEELGRIKVKFPKISSDHETDWVRIATLFTGATYGSFFLPQVDDEVLVTFEHGDINAPYVIGSLWNGKDKPPETNADGKNDISMIKTRSGHIVRFTEKSGEEKIEIIDKTEKNKILIDCASNKISIISEKDISIEAKNGTISLDAKDVSIKATSAVTIEGGTAEVKASGSVTVKGSVINLN